MFTSLGLVSKLSVAVNTENHLIFTNRNSFSFISIQSAGLSGSLLLLRCLLQMCVQTARTCHLPSREEGTNIKYLPSSSYGPATFELHISVCVLRSGGKGELIPWSVWKSLRAHFHTDDKSESFWTRQQKALRPNHRTTDEHAPLCLMILSNYCPSFVCLQHFLVSSDPFHYSHLLKLLLLLPILFVSKIHIEINSFEVLQCRSFCRNWRQKGWGHVLQSADWCATSRLQGPQGREGE